MAKHWSFGCVPVTPWRNMVGNVSQDFSSQKNQDTHLAIGRCQKQNFKQNKKIASRRLPVELELSCSRHEEACAAPPALGPADSIRTISHPAHSSFHAVSEMSHMIFPAQYFSDNGAFAFLGTATRGPLHPTKTTTILLWSPTVLHLMRSLGTSVWSDGVVPLGRRRCLCHHAHPLLHRHQMPHLQA